MRAFHADRCDSCTNSLTTVSACQLPSDSVGRSSLSFSAPVACSDGAEPRLWSTRVSIWIRGHRRRSPHSIERAPTDIAHLERAMACANPSGACSCARASDGLRHRVGCSFLRTGERWSAPCVGARVNPGQLDRLGRLADCDEILLLRSAMHPRRTASTEPIWRARRCKHRLRHHRTCLLAERGASRTSRRSNFVAVC